MQKITCQCEECGFNVNHVCTAEGIEVRSNGDNIVNSSEGTCCHTFRPMH